MAALLLNSCNHPGENKTADGNAGDGETSRPQKFAVSYSGAFARGTDPLMSIDLGSGNDGSSLAKAYTITLNTAPSFFFVVRIEPTFKPAAAKTDVTFAIQAIDPTTGADLTDATEVFDTKFGPAKLAFQAEPAVTSAGTDITGQIQNYTARAAVPQNTKIPASNTGHLAYKITITPKPGSAYDGHKVEVFVKIAIRG